MFLELDRQFGWRPWEIDKTHKVSNLFFLRSNSATGRDRAHKKSPKRLKDLIFIELGGQFGGDHEKLTKHLLFLSFFVLRFRDRPRPTDQKNRQNTKMKWTQNGRSWVPNWRGALVINILFHYIATHYFRRNKLYLYCSWRMGLRIYGELNPSAHPNR